MHKKTKTTSDVDTWILDLKHFQIFKNISSWSILGGHEQGIEWNWILCFINAENKAKLSSILEVHKADLSSLRPTVLTHYMLVLMYSLWFQIMESSLFSYLTTTSISLNIISFDNISPWSLLPEVQKKHSSGPQVGASSFTSPWNLDRNSFWTSRM